MDHKKEEKNIRIMHERSVNGLLLAPVNADHMPRALKNIELPVVLFDRQYNKHEYLFVGINNFRSSYMGTRDILEKGCRNIGFIGYSDPVDSIRQRIIGYKAALMELAPDVAPKVLYLTYNGGDSFPLIKRFIANEGLDGIVCATSTLCYELIAVVDSLPSRPKKSIKIITFDDNRYFDYLKYPVSVISQPVAEITYAALENLIQMIEQPSSLHGVKRELLFDVTIIDRE
jgi:LacI family transcriptional regulator